MKMVDTQKKAKSMGIKPGKMRKTALIQTIQTAEGNDACYKSKSAKNCKQMDCCWRDDCF